MFYISQISFIKCTVIIFHSSYVTHSNDSSQLGDFRCWFSAFELISTMWTPVEPIILVIILVFPSFDFCFFLDFAFCLNATNFKPSWLMIYESLILPFSYQSKNWTANQKSKYNEDNKELRLSQRIGICIFYSEFFVTHCNGWSMGCSTGGIKFYCIKF